MPEIPQDADVFAGSPLTGILVVLTLVVVAVAVSWGVIYGIYRLLLWDATRAHHRRMREISRACAEQFSRNVDAIDRDFERRMASAGYEN